MNQSILFYEKSTPAVAHLVCVTTKQVIIIKYKYTRKISILHYYQKYF